LEDLQPSIEVFNCYIKLHQFPAAYYRYVSDMRPFFRKKSLHLQLRADLLSELFPAGLEDYPLVGSADRGSLYNEMAQCLQFGGQPGKATALFRRAVQAAVSKSMRQGCCIGLGNLAYASLEAGRLRNAECAAGIGLVNLRLKADGIVPVTLFERADIEYPLYIRLATAMAIRGQDKDALVAFKRARRIQKCIHSQDYDLWVELGRFHLRRQRMDIVAQIVGHIGTWAKDDHDEYNQCHSVMLSGEMAMCQGQTAEARRLLNDALVQTRVWSHIANELRCLTLLARLEHQHGNVDGARALLADFWDPAERGPYLVHLANAFNLLSEIEQSTGHRDAAVEAAVRAYEAAWCDGPPYSYKYGLQASKRQLDSLGTQPPQLPAFDASKHEDAPNFRLDPPDEFSLKKFKRTRHRVHEEMLRRIKRRFGGDSKK
jgi:tetratricopeptide (TPR) repeat protein